MNARWISRMCAYKHSEQALESAKHLIAFKIERESALLRRYKIARFSGTVAYAVKTGDVLITEAQAAHYFWQQYKTLLPEWTEFTRRKAHSSDITNRLLDVGYHHLANIVRSLLDVHDISTVLALLHVPRKSDSAVLAYDLMELFRADTVDTEVLRYLRLKKKPLTSVEIEIPHFLHELNQRLNHLYYIKDFHQCHTYRYYMELQILKFIKAVNHKELFEPLTLPNRHDSRCLTHKKTVLS